MYEKIKKWYKQGLWTQAMMIQAVEKGILSTDEYDCITQGGKNDGN